MLSFIVLGFFRTYFSLFPTFNGITTIQNFHGITMLCWFAMLIIQPMLIRYGKYKWHRLLGKASYVLMPLILISLYLTVRGGYIRNIKTYPEEIDSLTGALALDFANIIAIAVFYILAIINKKKIAFHMRYMIATSLLPLATGIIRIFINYADMPFSECVKYSMLIVETIVIALIIYDKIKGKVLKPYLITLAILGSVHIFWLFNTTPWWQAFGRKFAALFF